MQMFDPFLEGSVVVFNSMSCKVSETCMQCRILSWGDQAFQPAFSRVTWRMKHSEKLKWNGWGNQIQLSLIELACASLSRLLFVAYF